MVYFRKNLKDKIRRHSWKNLYVWVKVQSDNLYIFSRACLTYHTGFRDFHRHFKFLRSLKFDFWADLTKRPVRNSVFLSPMNFFEKCEKYIGVELNSIAKYVLVVLAIRKKIAFSFRENFLFLWRIFPFP